MSKLVPLVQNGGNYKLFIEDYSGYVGINEDNPSYDLDVNGDAHVYGQLYVSSDERFKSDIKPIASSLDKIRELEGVAFKMKKFRKSGNQINPEEIDDLVKRKTVEADMAMSESSIPEANRYGFIAQELIDATDYINPRDLKLWYAYDNFLLLDNYTASGTEVYYYSTGSIQVEDFSIPSTADVGFITEGQTITIEKDFEVAAGAELLITTDGN